MNRIILAASAVLLASTADAGPPVRGYQGGLHRPSILCDTQEQLQSIIQAFDQGLGIDGAAAQCSDALADALIVAGTPDECVPAIAELRDLAAAEGYSEFYIGAPLGPDPHEAADLLISQVIPQVWPERTAGL